MLSIIIPVYNAEKTIVASLESCIHQTYTNWEIILVDDCSTDSSISKINDFITSHSNYSIRLIQNSINKGPSYSRNIAWECAVGDYVVFLDADDVWHPNKLIILNSFINYFPDTELFFHQYSLQEKNFYSFLSTEQYQSKYVSQFSILLRNPIATPCACCKRDIPERFDETLRYAEDHDLWLRITMRGSAIKLLGPPLTLLGRPILSNGGQSAARYKMRLGEIKMYHKYAATTTIPWLTSIFLTLFSLLKHLKSVLIRLLKMNVLTYIVRFKS